MTKQIKCSTGDTVNIVTTEGDNRIVTIDKIASVSAIKKMPLESVAVENKNAGAGAQNKFAVKLLGQTDETATIGGYGVVFGGADLEGDTFTPETDYDLDLVPMKRVYYDHTLGDVKHALGEATKTITDDVGLWVEAQLDRSKDYVEAVLKLIEEGVLGWSSGSIGHLVRREDNVIKAWPVAELSLTPTPAEPRTLGIERIKQLAAENEDLEALIPQDTEEVSDDATGDVPAVDININITTLPEKEVTKMTTENLDTKQPEPVDVAAIAANAATLAAEKAVKAYREKLEQDALDAKAINDGGTSTNGVKVGDDLATTKPFKNFGDFLIAVQRAATPGMLTDPRLRTKATGLSEGVPSDGGFLVGTDDTNELLKRTYELGEITQRVRNYPISANANGLTINAIDETSRVDGSRWGGIQSYWLSEAGTKTASKPKFRQMELRLKKLIGLCYAADELLADSVALGALLQDGFAEEFSFKIEDAIINGTGAGQPLGIMNSGAVVTVAKEVGQAANTVVAANIMKMWARMWSRSRLNSVWFINQDIEPQLHALNLPVGTGGQLVYMPPGGLSASPYASLYGRPVIPVEYMQTLGTTGDIGLFDLSQYLMINKGGMQSDTSIHVNFVYDETAWRFVLRTDGQPGWNAPLTPKNGTNTLSPFIVTATRS